MNSKRQKFISLFLISSLLILPMTLTANERRGANVEIYKIKPKMEGTPWETPDIRGELIAVKGNSLLLLDSKGADVSVNVADIMVVKVVKKSKVLIGGGIGFATGVIVSIPCTTKLAEINESTATFRDNVLVAGIFGAILSFPGMIIGGLSSMDETIKLAGKSDSEIKKILRELRKKARVPNYQ
jgi:hypothetical protein